MLLCKPKHTSRALMHGHVSVSCCRVCVRGITHDGEATSPKWRDKSLSDLIKICGNSEQSVCVLYLAFSQIWQGNYGGGGVPNFEMTVTCKTLGDRNRAEENVMLQICEMSCDPLHQIQRYNQLGLTVRWVWTWCLSQNLTHKSAKMCNANMCHLTPPPHVWIPARRSGAALTSESVIYLSASSEHRKSLLGGRKMFTSVKSEPGAASMLIGPDFPLVIIVTWQVLNGVADWLTVLIQLQASLLNKLSTLN